MKGIHNNSITSGSNKNFARMPTSFVDKPRSGFNRPSTLSTSFNSGKLVPIYWDDVLPGDSIDLDLGALITSQTPIVPFMTNTYLDIYAFFVPKRLLWDKWEDFITGADDSLTEPHFSTALQYLSGAADNIDDAIPAYTYFGIPFGRDDNAVTYSVMNLRAYFKIWADFFIPEFFVPNAVVETSGSSNPEENFDFGWFDVTITDNLDGGFYVTSPLLPVYKFHDYFTSALDNPQRGGVVSLPLGGSAPVLLDANWDHENLQPAFVGSQGEIVSNVDIQQLQGGIEGVREGSANQQLALDPRGSLYTDLHNATAATINDLRLAIATQKLLERDNFGQRYVEVLDAHFGVQSPDARLQRAEYLSHKRIILNVSTVLQNSSDSNDSAVGVGNQGAVSRTLDTDMKGFVKKSFVEHGVFMIVACVRCDNVYETIVDKSFYRKDRLDYYWPSLANIGNQPIYLEESNGYQLNPVKGNGVLGYQEAWAEYRYKPSFVTGLLNTDLTDNVLDEDGNPYGSLAPWVAAQSGMELLGEPTLRFKSSILDRVYRVNSNITHQFIANFGFTNHSRRVMPVWSVPSLESKF